MARNNMQIKLDARSIAFGVGFVIISLALFTWLLPKVLGAETTLTMAATAVGVAFWFLFTLSRSGTE